MGFEFCAPVADVFFFFFVGLLGIFFFFLAFLSRRNRTRKWKSLKHGKPTPDSIAEKTIENHVHVEKKKEKTDVLRTTVYFLFLRHDIRDEFIEFLLKKRNV